MKTYVYCRLEVEGFHYWPKAPDRVGFLAFNHRHMFHIRATIQVDHGDRQEEFILLKRRVETWLDAKYGTPCQFGSMSCEAIARELLEAFGFQFVEVSEDGENGAVVYES